MKWITVEIFEGKLLLLNPIQIKQLVLFQYYLIL